ncbi:uncharacterized protein LOC115474692 isoform X2 [Microcaecilia unicolor]|uniref:Uncharacterized protein LOC115474692 isoform X2 n=1 Tax=Microcaecilia unicolor TaxID=1415580 RepID=A0A6P7YMB6_9AMPH|nr:uncharacterized protein LOC115474692 isoform X2 [Microcaecilia unicolor]
MEQFHQQLQRHDGEHHTDHSTAFHRSNHTMGGKKTYKEWSKIDLICKRVNLSCICDLSKYMNNNESDIYDNLWVRVRFVNSTKVSNWTTSNQLNPFRDSILGPPILSRSLQDHRLTLKISMPFTRYCQGGTCLAVQEVLKIISYNITLFEDGRKIYTDLWNSGGKIINYTFDELLKPSCNYCVTVGVKNQNRFSHECFKTDPDTTGVDLIVLITCGVLILIFLGGCLYFATAYVFSSSKKELPRSLKNINEEMTVDLSTMDDLHFETDSISIVAPTTYDLEEYSDTELSKVELIPEKCNSQQHDSYHNNGFGPGYGDNDSYSSNMDCTGAVDVNRSLPSLGPMKENYSSNQSHSVASAIQPPTCTQDYLQRQLPIFDSEKPTDTSATGSSSVHYQENMKEGLQPDRARDLLRYQIDIPLNSVKFQASEQEFKPILEDFFDPPIDEMEENSLDASSTALLPSGAPDNMHKPQVKEMSLVGLNANVCDCAKFLKTQDSQVFIFSGYELRDIPLPI